MQWLLLAEKWKAILLIDHCDSFMSRYDFGGQSKEHSSKVIRQDQRPLRLMTRVPVILNCLDSFGGLLFLTSNKVGTLDESFRARMTLSLFVDHLDDTRRGVVWKTLLRQATEESNNQIRFSAAATKFLQTDQIHSVDWNGHEIVSCFQTATSIAMLEAKESPSFAEDTAVIVDVDHFKEALNRTFAFRAYINSVEGVSDSMRAKTSRMRNDFFGGRSDPNLQSMRPAPFGPQHNPPLMPPQPMMPLSRSGQYPAQAGQPSRIVTNKPATIAELHQPSTSDTEMGLCSPDLNRVEWQDFKDAAPAASGELFRKTKFHAIDVLVGEPCITFKVGSNRNKKRKAMPRNGASRTRTHPDNRLTECRVNPREAGEAPLPERIRINSLAIGKAFESIHDQGRFDFRRPFLVFRPFRSLSHYEQEFREWVARQEGTAKCGYTSCASNMTMI